MLTTLLLLTLATAQQPAPDPRQPAAQSDAQAAEITAAETALEQGHYPEAAELLRKLALATPDPSTPNQTKRILYDLGFADERTGDDTAAAKAYTAALAADPAMTEAHVALGLLDARAGDLAAAHTQLQAAATLTTASPELRARALRALSHLDEDTDPTAARDELLAAVRLTGETPADILAGATLADRAGSTADAESAYRHALHLTPNDPDAAAGLAHLLTGTHTAEADAILTDALKAHPDDPRLVAQLAALDAADPAKAPQAIALIEKLRASDPRLAADPALTRQLARIDGLTGDTAAAEALYHSLLATDPNDGPLLDDLGTLDVKAARFADAEAVLTKAVALRPSFSGPADWAEAAGHLAFAASRNNNPRGALQALAARATVLPNSAASLFLEAISHDALHQYPEAVRAYQAFLAMAGGKLPDEEFQARHRLIALHHTR